MKAPSTLVELLRWRAENQAERHALTFLADGEVEQERFTYGELDRRARSIAARLQEMQAAGERALLLYPFGLEFVAGLLGALYAGTIAVPNYPPRKSRHVARIQAVIHDAEASAVLTTARLAGDIRRWLDEDPAGRALRVLSTDDLDPVLGAGWRPPALHAETLALLQYTSGSTSTPKGVMVSHGNILHNSACIRTSFELCADSVSVSWLPSFHDMGLIDGILQPLATGFSGYLMAPAAFIQRPARWLRAISRYRATHSGGPNFGYELCTEKIGDEACEGLDLSCWLSAYNGAEPVRRDTLERFGEKFSACGFAPRHLYPCYGLAEGTLIVSGGFVEEPPVFLRVKPAALGQHRVVEAGPDDQDARALTGCGHPVIDTEILIVDPETLTPCPPDRVGEIWVASPSIAQGYWRKPEETERSFRAHRADTGAGPYFRTGDLGFLGGHELFVTGRIKDLIIIRGRNHYPQDIEATAQAAHPALRKDSGAAVAVEASGEERLVLVQEVARDAVRNLDTERVLGAVRQAVTEEHEVDLYEVVLVAPQSIPKTSSGKIQRAACRTQYLGGELSVIASWRSAGAVPLPVEAAAPEPRVATGPTETRRSREAIAGWLVTRLAALRNIAPAEVDVHAPFSRYGIDSITAVRTAGELQDWLGSELPATLMYDYPTIDALARRLAAGDAAGEVTGEDRPGAGSGAIAVVGLGCRFPGARDPGEFWRLLQEGVDAITEVPASRWDAARFHDPDPEAPHKMISRAGGFLEDVDRFDPGFFGIAPREAERMDPQQRLLLEVGWEALEDAGIAAERLGGSRTAVFVGISNSDYARLLLAGGEAGDIYLGTGSALSIAANRLSYLLDLRGPSLAVDTACSSSLVAVALACQSLRRGESNLALAGGVNLVLSPEYTIAFSKAQMMAPDGRCKAFDVSADGYVRGEGAGFAVLKRLEDAERDGDRILAVVRGVALNQDGRTMGLTAPNGPAQRAVIRAALSDAGIPPARVGYVEAHGTGTALGDPIEVSALKAVLLEGRAPDAVCRIGSVKTNIGHLESAAGIAGFIKAVLALVYREIPPSLHCREPNPRLEIEGTPIRIATRLEPWAAADGPRVSGVSSFGFGGTNAHVVLEEYVPAPAPGPGAPERPAHLLALSARDREGLTELARRYASDLEAQRGGAFPDVCFTASVGRSEMRDRLAVVAASADEARETLLAWTRGDPRADARLREGRPDGGDPPRVVFLFTGQGSQYSGMGRDLYRVEPVFRAAVDRCAEIARPALGASLVDLLYGDRPAPLDDMRLTQPAIFCLQYALTRLWASWGIEPAAVMGHSVGEFAAASAAGVLSLEDGLRLVTTRGRLLQSLEADGAMVSAMAGHHAVEEAIAPWKHELSVAAVNGPASVVFSGRRAAAHAALAQLARRGVKCSVLAISHASHSPLVEPILDEFAAEAARVAATAPRVPLVSNVTGTWKDDAPDGAYWRRHMREAVLFLRGLETLFRAGHDLFLEIGPHPTLSVIGEQFQGDRESTWVASLHRDEPPHRWILATLATLWTRGACVDWRRLEAGRARRKIALPTYPFRRSRCWLPRAPALAVPRPDVDSAHPLLGCRLRLAVASDDVVFESRMSATAPAYLGEHRAFGAAVVPTAAYLEMALAAAGADESGPVRGPEETLPTSPHWRHGLSASEARWPTSATPPSWLVEDVALLRPLRLADADERIVQTVLSPEGPDAWSWRVFSRPGDEDRPDWTLHATGRVRRSPAAAAESVDIAPLERTMSEEVEAGAFYDDLERRGIVLGRSFRLLSRIRRGEGVARAAVRAPSGEEDVAASSSLRPLLMDAALQVAAVAFPRAEGAYVQSGIERVRIVGRLGPVLQCHARRRERGGNAPVFDLRLVGADGRIAAEVDGLSFRPADPEALLAASPDIYHVEWVESRRAPAVGSTVTPRAWLIFADEGGTGSALAEALRAHGDVSVLARPGAAYGRDPDGTFRLRPAERADYGRLLEDAARALERAPDVVAHLWSLEAASSLSAETLRAAVERGSASAVFLLQALLDRDAAPGRLWLVTRRAQAAGGPPSDSGLLQSPIWGIGKSVALEHPERWGGLVDLDAETPEQSARRLAEEIRRSDGPDREDHVAFRACRRLVARIGRAPAPPRRGAILVPDATYLISGGLGGLGLALARRMVVDGARHLVLMGRSGASTEERRAAIRALEAAGAVVHARAVDVRDVEAVSRLVGEIRASLPPLRGIVHAAGQPGYRPLRELTLDAIDEVMGPKAEGALALRRATEGTPLDFFACVSSMVSAWGAGNQAHYVAANHFLDLLAHADRAAGRRAVTIGLGPLRGGMLPAGVAEDVKRMGVATWEMERAAAVLLGLLDDGRGHVVAAEVDWPRFRAVLEMRGRRPILHRLGEAAAGTAAAARETPGALAERLRRAPAGERGRLLADEIVREASRVLGMDPGQWPDLRRGFFDLGMNSLTALELKKRLETALGRRLPATLVFDHPNVEALRAFLGPDEGPRAGLVERGEVPAAVGTPPADLEAALAARLERLESLVERTWK